MNNNDLEELHIDGELVVAPKPYKGLAAVIGDDYDINAKLLAETRLDRIAKIKGAIDAEEDYFYGPATNYKTTYSYNRDD